MRSSFVSLIAIFSLAGCGALHLEMNEASHGAAAPAASTTPASTTPASSSQSSSSSAAKAADSAASAPSKLAALKRFAVPADLHEVAIFEGESHGDQDADFVLALPATIPELHVRVVGVVDGQLIYTPVARYLSDGRGDVGGVTPANAAGEQVVHIRTKSPVGTPFTVIASVDRVSTYDAYRVFGKPMPKATVAARDVGRFMYDRFTVLRLNAYELPPIASRLFATTPLEFFVFVKNRLVSNDPQLGAAPGTAEPLLRFGDRVLTLDGVFFPASDDDLTGDAPPKVAFSAPRPTKLKVLEDPKNVWDGEDFLQFLGKDEAASYRAKAGTARTCFFNELDRLDPNANSGKYDVVSRNGGRIQRVENLADRFARAAGTKCNVPAIVALRKRLEQKVSDNLPALRAEMALKVAKRFE